MGTVVAGAHLPTWENTAQEPGEGDMDVEIPGPALPASSGMDISRGFLPPSQRLKHLFQTWADRVTAGHLEAVEMEEKLAAFTKGALAKIEVYGEVVKASDVEEAVNAIRPQMAKCSVYLRPSVEAIHVPEEQHSWTQAMEEIEADEHGSPSRSSQGSDTRSPGSLGQSPAQSDTHVENWSYCYIVTGTELGVLSLLKARAPE